MGSDWVGFTPCPVGRLNPPAQVQEFVTGLVDNTRTSYELEVILNHNPDGEPWQVIPGFISDVGRGNEKR